MFKLLYIINNYEIMPFDGQRYLEDTESYLDTTTTNTALHPYGRVAEGYELNEGQREYYNLLEKSIQSKVDTLAANLHKKPEILSEITAYIKDGNTFAAETTLIQVVDMMKRLRLDETKMEYYEAIGEYVTVLAASNFGPQIRETKTKIREALAA